MANNTSSQARNDFERTMLRRLGNLEDETKDLRQQTEDSRQQIEDLHQQIEDMRQSQPGLPQLGQPQLGQLQLDQPGEYIEKSYLRNTFL